jgi:hypothetical protein
MVDSRVDEMEAFGDPNMLGTHPTTMEFTKEEFLTLRGNCIIGIKSSKACYDLNHELKQHIQTGHCIRVEISDGIITDSFIGYGHPQLPLTSTTSMVFRTSDFISDRTILIRCSKSAKKINRTLILSLKNANFRIHIRFFLENPT